MKQLLKAHTKWAKKAREEFKQTKHYQPSIGESFSVRENGDVCIEGIGYIKNCITPLEQSKEYAEIRRIERVENQAKLDILSMSIQADELEKDFEFSFLCVEKNGVCEIEEQTLNDMYKKFSEIKNILDTYSNNIEQEVSR